ncbi:MAG: carboxypeptidase-like regulatory domain-containing protein, partial [Chitinophagaceae bacterium]
MKTSPFLIISLITISLCNSVKAQTNRGEASHAPSRQTEIKGKVVDENHQGVSFATVTLLKAHDSSLVKGDITDQNGDFDFVEIPNGKYIVSASVVGMITAYSKPFTWENSPKSLDILELVLKQNANLLKGVSITASKPFIQREIDKTVVNVENSIVSAGSNAWEILQKSPGITVNNSNNTIRLQG